MSMHQEALKFVIKLFWHKDTPKVYYPHFADVWFKDTLTKDEMHDWKLGEELTIDLSIKTS